MVIGGSTGEGTSLEDEDYYNLIKLTSKIVDKKINVIAALSAVATEYAVSRVRKLNELGIDGIMCTVPHYIRPEQDGIIKHFQMLHDSSNLPLMLYIHLGRTGADLADSSILKLAECERIVAIKDAGSDIARPLRLLGKLSASNIFPNDCKALQNYLTTGNYPQTIMLQQKLFLIYEALFVEGNPIGVKWAMQLLILCSDEVKLPLTVARLKTRGLIEKMLIDFRKI